MATDKELLPKPQQAWGIYNFSRLIEICFRRKEAIQRAEELTGHPWKKCRDYMQIRKVTVTVREPA
jgi:hypothetical protein